MTTIETVAACIAGALFLLVLILLRSVSRIGVMTIPRKPPPRKAKELETDASEGTDPIESSEGSP